MRRKVDAFLDNWYESRKTALMIYGARQIGKSYSIEKFIKGKTDNYCLIDFSKRPDALEIFESFKDKNDFYIKLSLFLENDNNKSIIFFDEIQELYIYREKKIMQNPTIYLNTVDLLTITKALVQDDLHRYIFSGSMLGVTLNSVTLNPMGYIDLHKMFPMDFMEFLWANKIDDKIINYLKNCFDNVEKVDNGIHNKINRLFYEYILVGGMPDAVKSYINSRNFNDVSLIQESIINYYRADITKYANNDDKLIISEIYNNLASEVNNINKRFIKTHLDINNIKNLDIIDKYLWLSNSGIAIPVYNVCDAKYPLKLSEERKTFKLFYGDVGLLSYELFGNIGRVKFLDGEIQVNFGANFENVIAEELNSHNFKNLYYFNSKKQGEVDFIIEKNTDIIPIEIKSGKSNSNNKYNHNALDNILNNNKDIKLAYVLSPENTQAEEKIIYYPTYMIMFIEK